MVAIAIRKRSIGDFSELFVGLLRLLLLNNNWRLLFNNWLRLDLFDWGGLFLNNRGGFCFRLWGGVDCLGISRLGFFWSCRCLNLNGDIISGSSNSNRLS
jgi:hypothetical protein